MDFREDVLRQLEQTRACEPGIFWARQRDWRDARQAWERLKNESDPRWLPAIPAFMLDTVHRFRQVEHKKATLLACWFCRKTPMPGGKLSGDFLSRNAAQQLAAVEKLAGFTATIELPEISSATGGKRRFTLNDHAAAAVWDAVFYASSFANTEKIEALQRTSFYCCAAASRLGRGGKEAMFAAITSHVLHIYTEFRDLFVE